MSRKKLHTILAVIIIIVTIGVASITDHLFQNEIPETLRTLLGFLLVASVPSILYLAWRLWNLSMDSWEKSLVPSEEYTSRLLSAAGATRPNIDQSRKYDFTLSFLYDDLESVKRELTDLQSSVTGIEPTRQTEVSHLEEVNKYGVIICLRMTVPVAHQAMKKILSGKAKKTLLTISTDKSIVSEFTKYAPSGKVAILK